MDVDQGSEGNMVLRLFPLPGVVFFPHCVLPLHIFEPRYRQMTEDALDGDRLVTIVMIDLAEPDREGPPALEEYGCVGRILKHERLPDGRFNFLLLGLKRVRLIRELTVSTPYRQAEAQFVEDVDCEGSEDAIRATLIDGFRRLHNEAGGVDPDFDTALDSGLPLGLLCDLLAHALPLPAASKQILLAEPRVETRAATLASWLDEMAGPSPPRSDFPPTFSAN